MSRKSMKLITNLLLSYVIITTFSQTGHCGTKYKKKLVSISAVQLIKQSGKIIHKFHNNIDDRSLVFAWEWMHARIKNFKKTLSLGTRYFSVGLCKKRVFIITLSPKNGFCAKICNIPKDKKGKTHRKPYKVKRVPSKKRCRKNN